MLYIRSQDKTVLLPVNNFVIRLDDCNGVLEPKITADTYNNSYILGTYSSIDKAFQILNQIQYIIQLYDNNIKSDTSIKNYKNGIYEMPSNK